MQYPQLTEDERIEIYALKKAGFSKRAIARQLERDPKNYSRRDRAQHEWFASPVFPPKGMDLRGRGATGVGDEPSQSPAKKSAWLQDARHRIPSGT